MVKARRKVEGQEKPRLALRRLADEMDRIRGVLIDLAKDLGSLYGELHTHGLDDRGPITENQDDIPF